MISPLAYIHPEAQIGENVEIGPFVFIDKNVVIGNNNRIMPNANILYGSRIGNGNTIFPGAVIGAVPQDLKFKGEETTAEIGDNNLIRENVTINRGTSSGIQENMCAITANGEVVGLVTSAGPNWAEVTINGGTFVNTASGGKALFVGACNGDHNTTVVTGGTFDKFTVATDEDGERTITITGAQSVTINGNLTQSVGGTANIEIGGALTIKANAITFDTPMANFTGNVSIAGGLSQGGGRSARASDREAWFAYNINTEMNVYAKQTVQAEQDVLGGGVSLKNHVHGNGNEGANTTPPQGGGSTDVPDMP